MTRPKYIMHLLCSILLSLLLLSVHVTPRQTRDFTLKPRPHRRADQSLDSRRGRSTHVISLSEIKTHLHRFGYMNSHHNQNISSDKNDSGDKRFESAITRYQTKMGLPVTGRLDSETISQILVPRCGLPDTTEPTTPPNLSFTAKRSYVYFPGKPRWARGSPFTLTYAFSRENTIAYLRPRDIRRVFARAFRRWASVIPVSFVETKDYAFADIKIGFYGGDHGDGEPFDGSLGVLAHSFSPESGRVHLDEAEAWAVDFGEEESPVAVDLESVAVHEIGHVLGLGHSSVKEAVMYPSLKPRDKKVDLGIDDVRGVQALYGTNPNFTFAASMESYTSANPAADSLINASPFRLAISTLGMFFQFYFLCM